MWCHRSSFSYQASSKHVCLCYYSARHSHLMFHHACRSFDSKTACNQLERNPNMVTGTPVFRAIIFFWYTSIQSSRWLVCICSQVAYQAGIYWLAVSVAWNSRDSTLTLRYSHLHSWTSGRGFIIFIVLHGRIWNKLDCHTNLTIHTCILHVGVRFILTNIRRLVHVVCIFIIWSKFMNKGFLL